MDSLCSYESSDSEEDDSCSRAKDVSNYDISNDRVKRHGTLATETTQTFTNLGQTTGGNVVSSAMIHHQHSSSKNTLQKGVENDTKCPNLSAKQKSYNDSKGVRPFVSNKRPCESFIGQQKGFYTAGSLPTSLVNSGTSFQTSTRTTSLQSSVVSSFSNSTNSDTHNVGSNLGVKTKPYISKRNCNIATACGNKPEQSSQQQSNCIDQLPKTEHKADSCDTSVLRDFIGPLCRPQTIGIISTKRDLITNRAPKRARLKIEAHTKGVNRVKWNPLHDNLLASCSMDHTVAIWDTYPSGACRRRLTFHEGAVKDVKWSPCGTKILSCGYDKCARLVDLETGSQVSRFQHSDYVTCVQYHPVDSNVFLSGSSRTGIKSWDVRTEKVISLYQASFGQVQDLAFLPNGQEFFSAAEVIRRNSTDKGIMAWDYRTTAILSNQIYQEAFTCTSLKVHPSGTHFMAQSNGNYLAIFSSKRPYKLNKYKRYEGHKVSAYWIGSGFSPDGSLVVSGSADGNMYVYDHQTSRVINRLSGHTGICMDVAFHPSLPSTVASCDWSNNIIVWN